MSDPARKNPRGRPFAATQEDVERQAMRLFIEQGFAATTIPMIAEASGVSRTSVFRYWGSKSEIVWAEFDRHSRRLATRLAGADRAISSLTVVREQVVANLGQSMADSPSWMERFVVLDSAPELAGEEAQHWLEWEAVVARYVADRHPSALPSQPEATAAAVRAVFVAALRSWRAAPHPSAALLPELDDALRGLCVVLQNWLDELG